MAKFHILIVFLCIFSFVVSSCNSSNLPTDSPEQMRKQYFQAQMDCDNQDKLKDFFSMRDRIKTGQEGVNPNPQSKESCKQWVQNYKNTVNSWEFKGEQINGNKAIIYERPIMRDNSPTQWTKQSFVLEDGKWKLERIPENEK